MKKTLLAIAALGFTVQAGAAPKVIHFWHFNNLTGAYRNPGIPDLKASFSAIDTNKAVIAYKLVTGASAAYAGYIDNVAGTDTNTRLGITATTNNALRFRNPSDSAYMQIYIPTKGYRNIVMSYVLQSSSTTSGMLTQNFDYSIDSGATWKTSGLNINTLDVSQAKYQGSNWGLVSINFSADTAGTNNNNRLVFRIKFAGNTSGTSGNNRFDNVVVEGDSIIVTSGGGVGVKPLTGTSAAQAYPNPVRESLTLECGVGNKMIRIANSYGQVVRAFSTTEAKVSFDVVTLPAGRYFISIQNDGSLQQTLSFIKE